MEILELADRPKTRVYRTRIVIEVELVIPAAFVHVRVTGVVINSAAVLVAPSVEPSISSVLDVARSEHFDAFELPQITTADPPSSTGFGSAVSETAGAGGTATGIEHVATGLMRAPLTHWRKNRIEDVARDEEFKVARPTAVPPVANPVELAVPVRHDHETVTGVVVPNGTDDGEHESDGVSGGTTVGGGTGMVGGNVYGGRVGFCRGNC